MNKHEAANEIAKSIPPVTIAAATVSGWTLNDWVLVATLVYVVLQIAHLLYKWFKGK
jgi:uncharacterized membrane protein